MKYWKNGFSVTDVVAVLTDSADPKQYIKKMRSRDPELNARWGTICNVSTCSGNSGSLFLPGTLTVLRRKPGPRA